MTSYPAATVRVRFGPALRARVPRPYEVVTVASPATVGDVLAEVGRLHPALVDALPSVLAVVAGEQRDVHSPVESGAEIALLVAVSGGSQ